MTTALVLSGGGARGDFEVGAIKFLYEQLEVRPDIIVGSSVGAINGIKLAEGEVGGDKGLKGLERIWRGLRTSDDMWVEADWVQAIDPDFKAELTRPSSPDADGPGLSVMYTYPTFLIVGDVFDAANKCVELCETAQAMSKAKSVYTLAPIEEKLRGVDLEMDLVRGWANGGGKLRLAVVSLESGVLRYVTENGELVEGDQKTVIPGMDVAHNEAMINGVMASASIPVFFPPVKLAGENYVDGGVRDILPLQAAVDLAADQIFAVVASINGVQPQPSFDNKGLVTIAQRALGELLPDEIQRDETTPRPWWKESPGPTPEPSSTPSLISMLPGLFRRGGRGMTITNPETAPTDPVGEILLPRPPQRVTVIQPTVEVHGIMVIEPGLIDASIDYGYMRGFDVLMEIRNRERDGKWKDVRHLSDAITELRALINTKERVAHDYYVALPENVRAIRFMKWLLKRAWDDRVAIATARSVPTEMNNIWLRWERHDWPGGMAGLGATPWEAATNENLGVPVDEIDSVPRQAFDDYTPPDGTLVRERGTDPIFVLRGPNRYWVPDPAAFNARGFDWDNVLDLPTGLMRLIPESNWADY